MADEGELGRDFDQGGVVGLWLRVWPWLAVGLAVLFVVLAWYG